MTHPLPIRWKLLQAVAISAIPALALSYVTLLVFGAHPERGAAAFLVPMAAVCAGFTLLAVLLLRRLHRLVAGDLRDANDEAESASRVRGEFLAGLSHEMRTPLHAILSVAELGAQRAASLTPEKATRYYEMIEDGGRRLLDLLNDLVDLASLEDGKRVLRFNSAPIEGVVVGVVEEVRPLYESRGLGLEVIPCEPAGGWIDREALMQVLRHVLTSAARWSGPGGKVAVALVRSERASLLSVTCYGAGVAEAAGREFPPESSATMERPRVVTKGSEVKLAICRRIMAAHGGRIWAETRDGQSTTVHLEIPDRRSLPSGREAIDPLKPSAPREAA